MVNQWLQYYKWRLLNPIIPCAICKTPSTLLICKHCYSELEINQLQSCNYCAKPGPSICAQCHQYAPEFSHTYCQFTYATPLNKMLHHLKYKYDRSNIWALGYLLAKTLSDVKIDTDFILPVPLSSERMKQRGFNQVSELLRYYCIKLNHIPIQTNLAYKIVDTPQQISLNRQERQNQQTLFQIEKNITGKNILIVDDVITTGSTANNLARVLMAAGARRVELCTLMRTVKLKEMQTN